MKLRVFCFRDGVFGVQSLLGSLSQLSFELHGAVRNARDQAGKSVFDCRHRFKTG